MVELEVKIVNPKDPAGWLETRLPKSVMKRLQSYIETAKKNPVNYYSKLVGQISKSLVIEDKDNWFYNGVFYHQVPFGLYLTIKKIQKRRTKSLLAFFSN